MCYMKHLQDSCGDLGEKVSDKKHRVAVAVEEEALSLPDEERTFIDEHMNSYTKLLTDLVNVDVKIGEEDKAMILLNSLPDEEYETFTLTLINGRQILNYSEVSAALINYEVKRQERRSSSEGTSAEAFAVRGRSFNRKGRGDHGRSKSRPGFRDMKKNQCALCKELGHWKVDCLKTKSKKKESKTEANLAQVVSTHASTSQAKGSHSDSSVFSFSVTTPTVGYSGNSECIRYRRYLSCVPE